MSKYHQTLTYDMEKRGNLTKTNYLVGCIKNDMRKGLINRGDKLPSKRALAEHLGISVITVERAYEILIEEGYLRSQDRSGFYMQDKRVRAGLDDEHGAKSANEGYNIRDMIDLKHIHSDNMARIYRKILANYPEIIDVKSPSEGIRPFREAVASFLRRYRGMDVLPDQIVITSGSEHAYGLLSMAFGQKDDLTVAVEDPCYNMINVMYDRFHINLQHLKMGPNGIRTSELEKCHANVLHVSPHHNYPTYTSAPLTKKIEYRDWAYKNDAYIIEDDFDSDFNFANRPPETLYQIDPKERVIYLNTFSQSIVPSIRISYIVLPERLMKIYQKTAGQFSCTVPSFEQLVMSEYLNNGSFERRLWKLHRAIKEADLPNHG